MDCLKSMERKVWFTQRHFNGRYSSLIYNINYKFMILCRYLINAHPI